MFRNPINLCLFVLLLLPVTGCHTQESKDAQVLPTHELHVLRLTDSAHQLAATGDTQGALVVHRQALAVARKHQLREHEARSLMHI